MPSGMNTHIYIYTNKLNICQLNTYYTKSIKYIGVYPTNMTIALKVHQTRCQKLFKYNDNLLDGDDTRDK